MSVSHEQLKSAFDSVADWFETFYGQPTGPAMAALLGSCRAIVHQSGKSLPAAEQQLALQKLREAAEEKLEELAEAILQSRE